VRTTAARSRIFAPRALATAAIAALMALLPLGAPRALADADAATPGDGGVFSWFDPIIEVHRLVRDRFVTRPEMDALQLAAINAMIKELGDPYTVFVPAADLGDFNKSLRGEYVGIGASVRMEDGWMTIASPLEDSPAIKAGVMPGDRVVAIDGVSTMDEPLQQSIDRLTGTPGTVVSVTIERDDERFDLDIVRAHITPRTVEGFTRVGDEWDYLIDPANRVAYIRVTQFNSPTVEEFREAVESLRTTGGIGALIIDLRFNPGGLLPAAIEMADLFLSSGVIVSTRGRVGEDETVYAVREDALEDFPIAVLVNRHSASASEIVATALKGNDRAVVVGERTFGKGSVQSVVTLPSGAGQLKLTERQYYGPGDAVIHRTDDASDWGVDPNPGFFVPMTTAESNAMLRVRNQRSAIRSTGGAPAQQPPTELGALVGYIEDELLDPQLAAAVQAVELRIESGDWTPTGRDAGDESAQDFVELRRVREVRDRILRELDRIDRRVAALEGVIDEDRADELELIAEDLDLTGGAVDVYDARGNLIAELKITGEGLQRWLSGAPVEPR